MNRTLTSALLAITLTLGCGGVVMAAEEAATIRLVCSWEYSLSGENGARSGTSGENLISVTELGGGNVSFYVDGLGSQFIGKISDEEIYGETEYTMGSNFTVKETYNINRFTGVVERHFAPNGSPGLFFYGKCHLAAAKF